MAATLPWKCWVRSSAFRPNYRQLEPVRILRREAVAVPALPRLFRDRPAKVPQPFGYCVNILSGLAPDSKAGCLGTIAPAAEIVLGKPELAGARLEHNPLEFPAILPPLGQVETESLAVPLNALANVIDGKARRDRAESERLRLLPGCWLVGHNPSVAENLEGEPLPPSGEYVHCSRVSSFHCAIAWQVHQSDLLRTSGDVRDTDRSRPGEPVGPSASDLDKIAVGVAWPGLLDVHLQGAVLSLAHDGELDRACLFRHGQYVPSISHNRTVARHAPESHKVAPTGNARNECGSGVDAGAFDFIQGNRLATREGQDSLGPEHYQNTACSRAAHHTDHNAASFGGNGYQARIGALDGAVVRHRADINRVFSGRDVIGLGNCLRDRAGGRGIDLDGVPVRVRLLSYGGDTDLESGARGLQIPLMATRGRS